MPMTRHRPVLLAALLGALASPPSGAQSTEQVIVPEVERREISVPRFPSNDFEIGLFGGTYSVQNFGTSAVGGVRLGYHVTEDVFVEGAYAQTNVSDELFRQVLPGGIFDRPKKPLKYLSLSAGVNVLPGEIFIGRKVAKASAVYLIGGIGTTQIADQKKQTFNFGLGMRVLFTDRVLLRVDLRDHVFPLDLLGQRQTTQNLELTAGMSYLF